MCDQATLEMIQAPQGETFRVTNIVMLVANLLTLLYVAYIYYRQFREKANQFTLILVTLICIAILLGSCVYILLIMVFVPDAAVKNPRALNFLMGDCQKNLS